jgi:hypothetical protein
LAAAAATLALLVAPAATLAQQAPLPSYATPNTGETIHGIVQSFDGAYALTVRDQRGYLDNVTMHQGTVINPTGITLQPGFPVTIFGRISGNTLLADQIDTPFQYPQNYYPGYYGYPSIVLAPYWGLGWYGGGYYRGWYGRGWSWR